MKAIAQCFVLLLLLTGCAQLGLAPANNFEDKLAYAVGVHKAVQLAASQSLDEKAISSADAESVLKMADESRLILDGASAAAGLGDMATAEAKLALAQTSLVALKAYLTERNNQ